MNLNETSDEHEQILMGNEFHNWGGGEIQKKPCFPMTAMFMAQLEDVYQLNTNQYMKKYEQQIW